MKIQRITIALIAFSLLLITASLLNASPSANAPQTLSDPGETVTTHHETIPNPVFGSNHRVAEACQEATAPCAWEAASTWTTGTVPTESSRVIVDGVVVIGSETAVSQSIGIYPSGILSFVPHANTRLRTADLIIFQGGTLQVGTAASPIAADNMAEIVIRDLPFQNDPSQHLRGIVAVNGTVSMNGRQITQPYIRTAAEPLLGHTTIALATSAHAAGWRVGDAVVLPTSAQCPIATLQGSCPIQTEDHTIAAISADGLTVTLAQPLQFDHPGARDRHGIIDFLPHLVHKSRNVIVRSENPEGVRGHVLLNGRSVVDIQYTSFQDLGRTDIRNLGPDNQKGRYPLHVHHLIGPESPPPNGYQFTLRGNVIDFGNQNRAQHRKWGLAIHASHYGLVEQNIVDHASGAGLVTEDGSETGNLIRQNFVVRIVGGNGERTEDIDPNEGSKLGRAGVAYWFNGGGGNYINDNIAAAVEECTYCYGFKIDNVRTGDVLIPTSQGADPFAGGGQMVDSYTIGLTHFRGNEAYAVPNGVTIWWVCAEFETPREGCWSLMADFAVWHHHRWGYFAYETNGMTIDSFVHRGDVSVLENSFENVTSLYLVDYLQRGTIIRNADLQGAALGIEMPVHRDVRGAMGEDVGITRVENSLIVAVTNLLISSPSSTNGADDLSPQRTILRNVEFAHPPTRQNVFISINGDGASAATSNNPNLRNDIWIIDYNRPFGEDGDDLYMTPTYQDIAHCNAALGDCSTNISGGYPAIEGAYAYPLSPDLIPPPLGAYRLFLPLLPR
ncbi:MAG: G8 domain-containing protein [Chloroflexota bacterium]